MAELKVGGNVVAIESNQNDKRKIKKLTILDQLSKESIFNLIFTESEGGERVEDE